MAAIRRATPHQTGGGSATPKISPSVLAFCPSDLPVKNLGRPKWPEAATEASAI
jgi:hypothetical protein